jgi:DNA polymerase-3 subunit gamma/tau
VSLPVEPDAAEVLSERVDPESATDDGQATAEQADDDTLVEPKPAMPAAIAAVTEPSTISHAAHANLDSIREQVCGALEQAGHNTAAALLGSAQWSEQGEAILVQVAAKKTMLGLTINPEAERICREAMRAAADGGKPHTLTFVPGEGGSAGKTSPAASNRPAPTGSVQARAMENPLVRQAQELFHAEVRSVVDLRNK